MNKLTKYEIRWSMVNWNAHIIGQPKKEHMEFVRSILIKLDAKRT